MAARIIELADSVTAALNAATFSQSFTAERLYLPRFEAEELEQLRVSVVPVGAKASNLARRQQQIQYTVVIVIAKRVTIELNAMDGLLQLAEEIADYCYRNPIASGFTCTDAQIDPLYSPDHVLQYSVFTCAIELTFEAWP
jgi:hypothetical protein